MLVNFIIYKNGICPRFQESGKGYVQNRLQQTPIMLQQSTFWNCKDCKTSTTSKAQEPCLTYFPPKVLDKRQTSQSCRNFYYTKDELCEVDIQAKIANIQTQSVVYQTCSKPINRVE